MPSNKSAPSPVSGRQLLRHTLATLAYRGGKAFRGAPSDFAAFQVGESSRTPGQILSHIGDLLDWGLALAQGNEKWRSSKPLSWEKGVGRFFDSLKAFDDFLAAESPLQHPAERLFQGPIADAFTHVGQISMLRRLAGAPVRGENYNQSVIVAGSVGPRQPAPASEFD